jgi:hypothetical protein
MTALDRKCVTKHACSSQSGLSKDVRGEREEGRYMRRERGERRETIERSVRAALVEELDRFKARGGQ